MSTVVIVGGHGKVALRLAEALTGQGHTVRSTIRNEAHGADVEDAGAQPYLLDIEGSDAVDFADVFGSADAVVFSAGAGGDGKPERKRTVDLGGSLKSIEANPAGFSADTHTSTFVPGAVRGQLAALPMGGADTGVTQAAPAAAASTDGSAPLTAGAIGAAVLGGIALLVRSRRARSAA